MTHKEIRIAAILRRAGAALAELHADLAIELPALDERDLMEELACWKTLRRDVPTWHAVLCQHGF